MKIGMKKTAVSTALWATLMLTMGVSLSACSNEKEEAGAKSGEVLATDRVDEASELARKNAPEAEKMDFPESAPVPTDSTEAGTTGSDAAAAEDGAATNDTAGNTASADTAATSTESAGTNSAATAGTDTAATTEPATN